MKNNRLILGEIGFIQEITNYKQENSKDLACLYYPKEYFDERPVINAGFDIWSLGCVFYEICTGNAAFIGKEEIIENRLPPLHHKVFEHSLIVMIQEMLEFNSQDRPPTKLILKFFVIILYFLLYIEKCVLISIFNLTIGHLLN